MGRTLRDGQLFTLIGTITTVTTTSFLVLGPVDLPSRMTGHQDSSADAPPVVTSLSQTAPPFTVTPGDGTVTVSWPTGTPWSRYRADALNEKDSMPAASCRPTDRGASQPPACVLSGLRNGVAYLVSVLPADSHDAAIPTRMVHATPRPAVVASKDVAVWLDPSDLTSIQAARKGPARIGSRVMVLRDRSAHRTDATQSDNGFMPTVGQLGPLPALLLNGQQTLGLSEENLPTGEAPSTVVAVAAQDDEAGEQACFHHLLAWGMPRPGRARILHKGCYTSMAFAETFGTYVDQKPTQLWPTGKGAVVSAVFQARDATVRVNGKNSYEWRAPRNATMNTAGNTGASVGGVAWDPHGGWNGRIGDVLIFDRVLSQKELRSVEDFLAAKWHLLLSPE